MQQTNRAPSAMGRIYYPLPPSPELVILHKLAHERARSRKARRIAWAEAVIIVALTWAHVLRSL